MKKYMIVLGATLLTASLAWATQILDLNGLVLGDASQIKCGAGLTCTMAGKKVSVITGGAGAHTTLTVSGISTLTGGVAGIGQASSAFTNYSSWKTPTLTSGTSTTPSATTVYVTQVFIPINSTLTGVAVNNAGTCGTNKYIVALFDATGALVKSSALAGTMCSGTSAWQKVDFTATVAVTGPGVYWIGLYVDGTTDRFYTIPAVGAGAGLSGSVTGQTFGTIVALTLPTTFTADKGPVTYTY